MGRLVKLNYSITRRLLLSVALKKGGFEKISSITALLAVTELHTELLKKSVHHGVRDNPDGYGTNMHTSTTFCRQR